MRDDSGDPAVIRGASGAFSVILVTVIVLMFVCLALWVTLGIAIERPTATQSSLIDGVSKVFTGCVGALLGLLGGKLT